MVTVSQVQAGMVKYIDEEIISQISGWEKWALGAAAGIAARKAVDIFNVAKNTPVVKFLGVIDENDMIDLDLLYEEFSKQAKEKGAVTFNIPILGPLTLNATDVDKIYKAIQNSPAGKEVV